MSQLIATSRLKAIVGTGATGLSVARYLVRQGQPFVFFDTRVDAPNLDVIARDFPGVAVHTGALDQQGLESFDEIIVSPGVSLSTPALQAAKAAGVALVGDIELFARAIHAPMVAITGSNAKSTVTTLVGEMARKAGINVAVGGNLGTPALDLIDDSVELYVMELSSFQLETVTKLNAKVATILNISADHMDRYAGMPAYHAAKLRVYTGAEQVVVNRNDILTHPPLAAGARPVFFGGPAEFRSFGVLERDGKSWLAWELKPLMPVAELAIKGKHNIDNALAALALGQAVGLPMAAMLETLRAFPGLAHRCEWIGRWEDVDYINDSKGTNVGATLAAINGLARPDGKLILIAGGEGKGADFSALRAAVAAHVRALVLIGRDAPLLEHALGEAAPVQRAQSMEEAVAQARGLAQPGDTVLLSPACASFDMYSGFVERGEVFARAVRRLCDGA
ncbi:UDP-N-acetylmuramoyl-L-alanine--D-glutamate ligase [Marinimicrobium alkaliphilum]|uniref:UDP-N-acetylmuramoyl-L-alanine--D-glutamate ligase n=1 Tax=Marinimicrobium alkaliphilum TaxID=2202654 RepID=UPI0018E0A868|nr:UDP-N-acetylmuramoyl-L-alanine--D-glutamate ligase [Marinimicrobium alkaliphilum]